MFRVILLILIVLLIGATVGGYIAVSAEWITGKYAEFYDSHFSSVTGIASVIGLLALASTKKIRSTDFETEELDKLKSLMITAEELDSLEKNKDQTAQQLVELERKKKLMELSVQKAGLVLFYKNQLSRYEAIILEKIKNDDDLKSSVNEIMEATSRLFALNEEIDKDENVEIICSILERQNPVAPSINNDPIQFTLNTIEKMVTKFVGI